MQSSIPYTGISSSFLVTTSTTSNSKSLGFNNTRKININGTTTTNITCKAASSSSSWITDFDLYDLLGIDSSSDQSQIKSAYRALQKRCHPDIAGPTGHDMAIILNQAYSVLSDPSSRFVYDKEQSKISELRGYTGKPIYSVWYGSESENRAVFVDEVKCIGCLKCALLAEKTFAVETIYGRARVVSQWADSENKIQEAIDACPVDCISIVERSNLAALEFLMSKQPRGNVRVGASNTVGARVSNIFVDVMKFQTRFQNSMEKNSSSAQSTEPESQREARSVAIQTIRSISNWLYWQQPNSNSEINTSLTIIRGKKYSEPKNINKLREAVEARKHALKNGVQIPSSKNIDKEEYWVPSTLVLPQTKGDFTNSEEDVPESSTYSEENNATTNKKVDYYKINTGKEKKNSLARRSIPLVAAIIAGTIINQQIEQGSVGRVEEHIGGSFALGIVNSSWSQVILAGITWYLISMYVIEIVLAFTSKVGGHKK